MKSNNIFFRADGDAEMGLGHVIRSLAFLEMLKDDYTCFFVTKGPTNAVKEIILNSCEELIEIPSSFSVQDELNLLTEMYITKGDLVILDGYHFDTAYQLELKKTNCFLLSIDDIHDCHFVSDVVINHSLGIKPENYSIDEQTQLYLGPKYALLRSPFLMAFEENKRRDKNRLLICFGGADPNNDTVMTLKMIGSNHAYNAISIVVGSAFLFEKELLAFEQVIPRARVYKNISAVAMTRLMEESATAILSASTVSIEYLSIGGCLYVKQTVDNQKYIFKALIEEGYAFDFEKDFGSIDSKEMNKSRQLQLHCFDRKSDERLRAIVNELFSSLNKK